MQRDPGPVLEEVSLPTGSTTIWLLGPCSRGTDRIVLSGDGSRLPLSSHPPSPTSTPHPNVITCNTKWDKGG